MSQADVPNTPDRPLVVVDVGCRWGVAEQWEALGPGTVRLYAFDADPEECRRLQQTAPPHVTYVPHALADTDGRRTLHVAVDPACSSLFPPDATSMELFPTLENVLRPAGETEIAVRTLDGWAADAGVNHVDVIKLDVQGAEVEVLQGAEDLLRTVRVIEAEVSFNPMYEGQALFGDVDAFLRARGFRLWRLNHLVHYASPEHGDAPGRHDRQFFEERFVDFESGPGQLTWGHALYVAEALLRPARRATEERRLDAVVLRASGLEELAVPPAQAPAPAELSPEEAHRVKITTAAGDTDAIPKVADAGLLRVQDGTSVQVMHNGVVIEEGCYHGRWMTEVIHRLRGHHEPQEERAFHEIVQRLRADTPAPVMIELGSFWAYYSLWLAHEIPGTRSVLVEPDAHNLATGLRNFALNGLTTEHHVQAAVGLPDGGTTDLAWESDGMVRTLPLVSVDGLAARLGLDRVDLVLCDTQGAEVDALRGMADLAGRGGLRFLVISTHHQTITGDPLTHDRCLEVLAQLGAQIIAQHTVLESASGDGLIVASLDPRDTDFHVEVSRTNPSASLFAPAP
jgi:FkbM family methyltransferase